MKEIKITASIFIGISILISIAINEVSDLYFRDALNKYETECRDLSGEVRLYKQIYLCTDPKTGLLISTK